MRLLPTTLFVLVCYLLPASALGLPRLTVSSSEKDTTLTLRVSPSDSANACTYTLFGSQSRKKVSKKSPSSNTSLYSWSTVDGLDGTVAYQASGLTTLRARKKGTKRPLFFRVQEVCDETSNLSKLVRSKLKTSVSKKRSASPKSFLTSLAEALPSSDIVLEDAFPNLTFTTPVDLRNAGDGTNRLFVVEQTGLIKVFENASETTEVSTFLDLSEETTLGGERGIFSIAFHPQFSSNGYAYVHFTDTDGNTVVARYTVDENDSNKLDPSTKTTILTTTQPTNVHNGGSILFGPDGYLYITLGDGGNQVDPDGNGQNTQTLLGSILRIDVDGGTPYAIPNDNPFLGNSDGDKEEIFAYGLRNPWRASFDSLTGELYVGDVGQSRYEEIDIIENGQNYGWVIVEGETCIVDGCDQTGLTLPLYVYGRDIGNSITGGYVYRGSSIFSLYGKYIFGDFISGRILFLSDESPEASASVYTDTEHLIATFGEDEAGEVYYAAYLEGRLYRFTKRS